MSAFLCDSLSFPAKGYCMDIKSTYSLSSAGIWSDTDFSFLSLLLLLHVYGISGPVPLSLLFRRIHCLFMLDMGSIITCLETYGLFHGQIVIELCSSNCLKSYICRVLSK